MNVKKTLKTITESRAYKKWKEKNQDSFLCSFFKINEPNKTTNFQTDFYNPSRDTMSSFVIENNETILTQDDAQIFKKEGDKVYELNLKDVKLTEEQAIQKVQELKEKEYKKENIVKTILILQKMEKTIWNINSITKTFNILNIKIDAATGDILEHEIKNPIAFKKK